MEVIIRPNAESAAEFVADLIAQELSAKANTVLGLATGRTMERVYQRLVLMHRENGLDFSRCHTFNLDEYAGLAAENPNSYHYFMRERLFQNVNIDSRRTHLPNGLATDPETEGQHYENLIAEAGGIDLQLLGIGLNGHLGFNEPYSGFDSRTRVVQLAETTRQQNARLFPDPAQVPQQALTMGIATILEARRCLLLATGQEKAEIIAKAISGSIVTAIPASALQWHPDCTIVLDEPAASLLNIPENGAYLRSKVQMATAGYYRRAEPPVGKLPSVPPGTTV